MHGFVCPHTHRALALSDDGGALLGANGVPFLIRDGIPDFALSAEDYGASGSNQEYYRSKSNEYDRGIDVMFRMLLAEEALIRNGMIDEIKIGPGARVLEIGCGTCRDTLHLLARSATVYAGDLSLEMLAVGRHRLIEAGADFSRLHLFRGDVMRLPFADGFFDGVFHFGGLNLFPDIGAAFKEMTRVVRPGGRVVAGDEGVAPWLRNTEFAKILINSNPLFSHSAPLDKVPISARNVACRWILGGSFYLISFESSTSEPQLDLDVEFPGWRGGSHRTRYFGRLEGVSPQLRETVVRRAATEGVSISAWLEKTLRQALQGSDSRR